MSHPDEELKVGTTREAADLTWTLYRNQFGTVWKAGPLAHNIKVNSNRNSYRLEDRLVNFATFEKAADAAIDLRQSEVDKARKLVAAYDAAAKAHRA